MVLKVMILISNLLRMVNDELWRSFKFAPFLFFFPFFPCRKLGCRSWGKYCVLPDEVDPPTKWFMHPINY